MRGARSDLPSSSAAMPPPRPAEYNYPGQGDVSNGLRPSQSRGFDYSQLASPSGLPDHGPREFPSSGSATTPFNPYNPFSVAPAAYPFDNFSQDQQHDAGFVNPANSEQASTGTFDYPRPDPSEDPSTISNAAAKGEGKKRRIDNQAEDTATTSVDSDFGSTGDYLSATQHGPPQSRIRVPLPGKSSDVTIQDGPSIAGPSTFRAQGGISGAQGQVNDHTGRLARHDSIFDEKDTVDQDEDDEQANERFLAEWREFP
jgi:hypothetical protein